MLNKEIKLSKVNGRKILETQPNAFCLASVYRLLVDSYPQGNHGIQIPVSFTEQELRYPYETQSDVSEEKQQIISNSLQQACDLGYLSFCQTENRYFFTDKSWAIFQEIASTIRHIRR